MPTCGFENSNNSSRLSFHFHFHFYSFQYFHTIFQICFLWAGSAGSLVQLNGTAQAPTTLRHHLQAKTLSINGDHNLEHRTLHSMAQSCKGSEMRNSHTCGSVNIFRKTSELNSQVGGVSVLPDFEIFHFNININWCNNYNINNQLQLLLHFF